MAKTRFAFFQTKEAFNRADKEKYSDSIVFIKSSQEIWTHDTFFAIPDTYKDKITELSSRLDTTDGNNAAIQQDLTQLEQQVEQIISQLDEKVSWSDQYKNRIVLPYASDANRPTAGEGAGQIIAYANPDCKEGGKVWSDSWKTQETTEEYKKKYPNAVSPNVYKEKAPAVVLAQMSKYNVQEYGSQTYPINLQGSKVRPTYNDDEELALISDLNKVRSELQSEIDEVVSGNLEDYVKKEELSTTLEDYYTKEEVDAAIEAIDVTEQLEDYSTTDQIESMLESYINDAEYDSESSKILLKNKETDETIAEIDAAPFIQDGMVSDVEITEGTGDNEGKQVLKVTFNTDAGQQPIEVLISEIFNPDNYYTSEEIDDLLKKLKESIEKLTGADIKLKTYSTTEVDYDTYLSEHEPVGGSSMTLDNAISGLGTGIRSVKDYVDEMFSWDEQD